MKKKLVTILLAVVSVVTLAISLTACGEKESSDFKLDYELSADSSFYTITSIKINSKEKIALTIPAEYEGKPVKRITGGGGSDNGKISSLTIPNSITYIGERAFQYREIDKIIFGDYSNAELTTHDTKIQPYSIYLGAQAFKKYMGTSIELPTDIYLDKLVFTDCPITTVKFNGMIYGETTFAFSGCPLKAVEFPEPNAGMSYSVGIKASMEYVVIPENVNFNFNNTDGVPKIYYKGLIGSKTSLGGNSLSTTIKQDGQPDRNLSYFVYEYSESGPLTAGLGYWHYVNGIPTEW